ncbi:flagellar biosynthesis protein [Celeribacter sp.]|uniref:FliH/SctL family protein n=1 Tax=Celeribacter sp. TaxID=1890673 RepID=UPI003A8CBFC0
MPSPFTFEDFSESQTPQKPAPKPRAQPPGPTAAEMQRAVEDAKSEGYESGYRAGWDDAVKAEEETRKRIGAELARNLQDLGFTFHEARAHVIRSLEPLFSEMTEKVLPELASQSLGQLVIEELMPVAEKCANTPVEILVCPANLPAIEALVQSNLSLNVHFIEEPSLSDGQVFLRLGTKELKIDLDGAIEKFRSTINAAFTLNKEAMNHG